MQPTTMTMFTVGVIALISWLFLNWRLDEWVPSSAGNPEKDRW